MPEGGSDVGPVVEASSDGPAGPRAPLTVLLLLAHSPSAAIPVVPSVPPPPTAPPAAPSPLPFGPALCSQPPLGPIAPSLGSGAMNAASATGGDADTPAASWVAPAILMAATPRRSNSAVRLFLCFMTTRYLEPIVLKTVAAQGTEPQQPLMGRRPDNADHTNEEQNFRRKAPAFSHVWAIASTSASDAMPAAARQRVSRCRVRVVEAITWCSWAALLG